MDQKLKKIEISGYKSISALMPMTLDLGRINILLGANGAGKSNVVSFFRMLDFLMEGKFQKSVALAGGNAAFLHYGPKITSEISAHIAFEDSDNEYFYDFKLLPANGQKLLVNDEQTAIRKKGEVFQGINFFTCFNESALYSASDSNSIFFKNLISNCKVYQFSDSSHNSPLRQASKINTAQYLQSDGGNIASFLYLLKNNYLDSYRRIVSYIKMVMPCFGDFYLEPVNNLVYLNWKDNSANDYVFGVEQFSDGAIRFIALATLLLQPAKLIPGVIVIDEPELGLHPYAVDQLTEMIEDAALHSQLIIATQSKQIIDNFDADCISVVEFDDVNNRSVARKLDVEQLREWLQEYSISELWTKNVIGGQPLL
ncbi:MAG: AAA family ATPase [Bacteroidales bacterium]|nr:AAA family ATPase [Bacteroidales bacterium]